MASKTISCFFVNHFESFEFRTADDIKKFDTGIKISVNIDYSPGNTVIVENLASAILMELNKKYPGIEAIDLYISDIIYKFVFSTNAPGTINLINGINQDLIIDENNFKLLSKVFIVITKIYGLRNFKTISEVTCNYNNLEGIPSFVNMLLPNVPLPLNIFRV